LKSFFDVLPGGFSIGFIVFPLFWVFETNLPLLIQLCWEVFKGFWVWVVLNAFKLL
jgi:hypothetical protein